MFIYTISDVVGLVVVLLVIVFVLSIEGIRLFKQARCKHERVFENRACDAICRDCGKNLGFIKSWREQRSKQ